MKPSKAAIERALEAFLQTLGGHKDLADAYPEELTGATEAALTAAMEPSRTVTIQYKAGDAPADFLAGYGLIQLED